MNDQSAVTASTFMTLLNQLNVTVEEFSYIQNNYKLGAHELLEKEMKENFIIGNINRITQCQKEAKELYKNTGMEKYNHIYLVSILLINRLKKETYNLYSINVLKDYLLNLNVYTYYDLRLFTSIFFAFSKELNEAVITKILKNASTYSQLNHYGSDVAKILCNMIIFELESGDFKSAKKYLKILETVTIESEHILERILKNFFKGVNEVFDDKFSSGRKRMEENIHFLKVIKNNYYYVLEDVMNFILKKYSD